jgi:hypothetical protein
MARVKVRSNPAARGRRWISAALALAALACPSQASADELVAALWLRAAPRDERILQRVRGQVSDLPVRLVEVREPGAEASLGEQLEAADAIARKREARAVVWFAPLDPRSPRAGLLVIVAEAARGRVLVRRVEGEGASGDLDSAGLEAAALAVRTALRGLAEGAVIGLERTEIAPPRPAAPPPPSPTTVLPPAPPPAPRGRWTAALGWHLAHDGEALQQGLAGHVGYGFGRWSLGLSVATSLGAALADARASIHLSRHAFGGFAELAPLRTEQLELGLSLSAGAALFPRTTGPTVAAIVPEAAAPNPAFFVGLAARARWFPRPLGGFVGAWIEGGADVVPAAPTLGYELDGRFVPAYRLWRVQPGGALGFSVRTP